MMGVFWVEQLYRGNLVPSEKIVSDPRHSILLASVWEEKEIGWYLRQRPCQNFSEARGSPEKPGSKQPLILWNYNEEEGP